VPYIRFVVFLCCRIYGSAVVRVSKRPKAVTGRRPLATALEPATDMAIGSDACRIGLSPPLAGMHRCSNERPRRADARAMEGRIIPLPWSRLIKKLSR